MSTKLRRKRRFVEISVVALFLCLTVADRQLITAIPAGSSKSATARALSRHYIVQAETSAIARRAVVRAGGSVSRDLQIIRAVAATLDDRELALLRKDRTGGLRIYDDAKVSASSAAGAPPETYYPSEVAAQPLQAAGKTGRGVTVAVIDSGLWNQEGPLQSAPGAPGQSASRVLAQYDVILAREVPGYYAPAPLETYSRDITDPYGHGTHVTSIIASSAVAESGNFQGVAPGVNLVAVRALDSNGTGLDSDVISGIEWVISQQARYGIRVLNLSLGAPRPDRIGRIRSIRP